MKRWRVFYFRTHRGADNGKTEDRATGEIRPASERRDQTVIESDQEPTVEDVAKATEDEVLRLDGVEEIVEKAVTDG